MNGIVVPGGRDSPEERFRALNGLTERVIGGAIAVHRALGPGLLESAYGACFAAELEHLRIPFEREVAIPLHYRGRRLDCGYRLDFLVDDQVIVEIKAVRGLDPVFTAQALTYLRLTRRPIALILNFNVSVLKNGIHRIVL